jgi:hypothetical protein
VSITLTRREAAFVQEVMTRIACDKTVATAWAGLSSLKRPMTLGRRIATKAQRRIEKRDAAMRAKGYGTDVQPDPDLVDEDQPFEELAEEESN